MKKALALLSLFSLLLMHVTAQYKNDNTSFKNIYLEDLCSDLKQHPKHLLLDVRSAGEYADTSQYKSLNIGRLQDAVNISIQELNTRWKELIPYKDETIYIYCSHSQRSRRASKMLADSGFTHIVNINGGMTNLNLRRNEVLPCAGSLYQTKNPYPFISPAALIKLLQQEPGVFLLDIRSDSAYNGISTSEGLNALGRLKHSVHIPAEMIDQSFDKIPNNKNIIVIDEDGSQGHDVAQQLKVKGYTNVQLLFNGMNAWVGIGDLPGKEALWEHPNLYRMITAEEMNRMFFTDTTRLLLDVRTANEFNNRAKEYWKNKGSLKAAVNIPFTEMQTRIQELDRYKNQPVIVYDFSGQEESFKASRMLADAGFTKVYLMMDGIFDLRWKAANIKELSMLNDWVVNIPDDNK